MPAQMEHFLENVTLHVQIKEASLSIFTNAHLTQDLTKTRHRIYMMVLCTQVNEMYVIATLSVYPHRIPKVVGSNPTLAFQRS